MVSVAWAPRYQSPWKVYPLGKAEFDSTELADMRAD